MLSVRLTSATTVVQVAFSVVTNVRKTSSLTSLIRFVGQMKHVLQLSVHTALEIGIRAKNVNKECL